jgi:hypothetical protein
LCVAAVSKSEEGQPLATVEEALHIQKARDQDPAMPAAAPPPAPEQAAAVGGGEKPESIKDAPSVGGSGVESQSAEGMQSEGQSVGGHSAGGEQLSKIEVDPAPGPPPPPPQQQQATADPTVPTRAPPQSLVDEVDEVALSPREEGALSGAGAEDRNFVLPRVPSPPARASSSEGEDHKVRITRQASFVKKSENDKAGACLYHPDLGYVGDGPPETEEEAEAFARRAEHPEEAGLQRKTPLSPVHEGTMQRSAATVASRTESAQSVVDAAEHKIVASQAAGASSLPSATSEHTWSRASSSEGEEHKVRITRQASFVKKSENDKAGACLYHPDLGYVGDGPPETEEEAEAFARRAENPELMDRPGGAKSGRSGGSEGHALGSGAAGGADGKAEAGEGGGKFDASPRQTLPKVPCAEGSTEGVGAEEGKVGQRSSPSSIQNVSSSPPPFLVSSSRSTSRPTSSMSDLKRGFRPIHWVSTQGVHWGYFGENRSLEEILCQDLRRSGFLSPAFVNPNLREERQKMLLSRKGVHGLSMLQPIAHEMLGLCNPDGVSACVCA